MQPLKKTDRHFVIAVVLESGYCLFYTGSQNTFNMKVSSEVTHAKQFADHREAMLWVRDFEFFDVPGSYKIMEVVESFEMNEIKNECEVSE